MAESKIKQINLDFYNNVSYYFKALSDGRIAIEFDWVNAPTNAVEQIVFAPDYIRVDKAGGISKQVSLI
jgi:hypothetical protein